MQQTGDIAYYVSRMQVRRKVAPISFIDDDLSIITYKHQRVCEESQNVLTVKKYVYQHKLEK